ncbi:hypothetical protein F5Y17DRAFT_161522 [Xylariaceae sp. FL0594]|nr:hypothetical protein F5Y17DRAFT_161522 [Xylariaceae sp. FL0594]
MMSHNSSSSPGLEAFGNLTSTDGDRDRPGDTCSQHHRRPSMTKSQNEKAEQSGGPPENPELNQICRNPNPIATKNSNNKARRIGGSRLKRPSLTYNTFEVLNTVSESESEAQNTPAESDSSDDAEKILELPVEQYSAHPLSVAARHIPPLKEQLSKHSDGFFEWILAIKISTDSPSQRDTGPDKEDPKEAKKVYFGCNLLPKSIHKKDEASAQSSPAESFLLLITPIKETNEVLAVFRDLTDKPSMALEDTNSSGASVESLCNGSTNGDRGDVLELPVAPQAEDATVSKSQFTLSPTEPVTRIEDSFEALDQLEEQLEAFDKVTHLGKFMPSEKPCPSEQPPTRVEPHASHASVRFATPQPPRACTATSKLSASSLRFKPASEPQKPALRKVHSMVLSTPKLGFEDKGLAATSKGGSTLARQKSVGRQAYLRTTPALEPQRAFAGPQSQEKKDGRLTSQRATQPTEASLRRAKSTKLPTRPAFELPGEAISRRKREEHLAQLKAQEEEERKRREFKARPPPSKILSATAPRETIASRARQVKTTWTENTAQTPVPFKYAAATIGPHSRSALLSTVNQQLARGRDLKGDGSPAQASRATSASTGSVSEKRSSVSHEDVQTQKLRGHEIYKRDNSWTDDRARQRQHRELLAKLAREEAAERSRQQSREWAARQARKRATVSSLRDVFP